MADERYPHQRMVEPVPAPSRNEAKDGKPSSEMEKEVNLALLEADIAEKDRKHGDRTNVAYQWIKYPFRR
jgi:hypothetical protein